MMDREKDEKIFAHLLNEYEQQTAELFQRALRFRDKDELYKALLAVGAAHIFYGAHMIRKVYGAETLKKTIEEMTADSLGEG